MIVKCNYSGIERLDDCLEWILRCLDQSVKSVGVVVVEEVFMYFMDGYTEDTPQLILPLSFHAETTYATLFGFAHLTLLEFVFLCGSFEW